MEIAEVVRQLAVRRTCPRRMIHCSGAVASDSAHCKRRTIPGGVDSLGTVLVTSEEQLATPGKGESCGPSEGAHTDRGGPSHHWTDLGYEWLTADRLQVTRIHELLAGRGCRVSYTSLRRFIQRRGWQRRSPATVRMGESAPGEVAEMDFGRMGCSYRCQTALSGILKAFCKAEKTSRAT